MYKLEDLKKLTGEELRELLTKLSIQMPQEAKEQEIIYKILDHQASMKKEKDFTAPKEHFPKKKKAPRTYNKGISNNTTELQNKQKETPRQSALQVLEEFAREVEVEGVVEIMPDGYGFLRSSDYNYLSSPDDVYVAHYQIRNWGLKKGDTVKGKLRPPREGEKYFGLLDIDSVNGRTLEEIKNRISFEYLTPLYPEKKIELGYKPNEYANRIINLFIPIGFGQRFLIAAPPKAGKTTLLKSVANGIVNKYPDVYLIVLMIGERPEEVTDMRRNVKAEVIGSTFDQGDENHVKVADIVLEKAKSMVECGHDVVILLDSITRLARAHNIVAPTSGKILSGGVDANALQKPKQFFGAARNIENGGSLTIIATTLKLHSEKSGSRMDNVIFEEFKGTGNSELILDRELANKNYHPAINLNESSTRRGETLLTDEQLKKTNILRRVMSDMKMDEAHEFLLNNMRGTENNEVFLDSMEN